MLLFEFLNLFFMKPAFINAFSEIDEDGYPIEDDWDDEDEDEDDYYDEDDLDDEDDWE